MNLAKNATLCTGSGSELTRRLAQTVFAGITAITLAGVYAFGAENPMIGAAQRELKRQQFYSGEITNTVDDATKDAARRFQIRHGLKVTGELDGPTLAALAASDAPTRAVSTASQAEENRPPARERSQSIVRDDLDILRELEAEGTAPPPGWKGKGSRQSSKSSSTSSAPGSASSESSATPAGEALRRPRLSSSEEHPPSRTAAPPQREIIPPQQN